MGRSSINEVLTSVGTNESNSEGEGGLEQFLGFSGVKSTVERKESLLDEVAEEETEIELVLGELSLSRKKKVESRSKKVVKAQSTWPMTGVDEGKRVAQGKRRMAESLGDLGEKVAEGRPALMDDLKEVEERARLAILKEKEDMSQMVARLVKGIWLGIEEQESELKKAKSELVKAKTNFNEMAKERDRLGCHLMLKGYSQEEVDAIKADTYVEEEEEEAEVMGVVDGLDGVSPQMVLDNQRNDVELPEGGSEKVVREMSLRINDIELGLAKEKKTSKALLSARTDLQFNRMKEANKNRKDQYIKAYFRLEKLNQAISDLTHQVEEKDSGIKKGLKDLSEATERAENLQCQVDALVVRKFIGKDDKLRVAQENLSASEAAAKHLQTTHPAKDIEFREIQRRCDDLNERVTLKPERDQAIARAKKAKAREYSRGSRTVVKAPLVQGDIVSLSGRIRELESDASRILGNVQKGNANLRECQHKLDTALIREKVLEGKIKAKKLLVKKKEELLKDPPGREELNAELRRLPTQIVDLEAMNLASCYKRLKARFATVIIPGVPRSGLLRVIVAYFIEEVKKLESERDTLLKTLSDKGCACGAKIDRGNYLGAMETQLGPQTAESIARGKVVMARELKDRPLDDLGESIADTPSAEKNLL
ncbi:hypothetical protein GIB67_021454 [Kingdonia uniflora]|uniref:Uncharacterized protein n=1 Tax=Kingdonia uniflora TaxID=39325 RepID=A0A7J7NQH8_9MAGN|nr:hypothetical protein GIB67_021454 [Kingdonia uniflora]